LYLVNPAAAWALWRPGNAEKDVSCFHLFKRWHRMFLAGKRLNREQARQLAGVSGDDVYDLFYWANKIRIEFKGRDVRFCAIVSAKDGGMFGKTVSSVRSRRIMNTAVQGQTILRIKRFWIPPHMREK